MESMIGLLRQVPLFAELSDDDLSSVIPLFNERKYRKGSILFFEGDEGTELYIVKMGVVRVYRLEQDKEITLALFRDGDFFGDMAVIQKDFTRSATAETMESTVLYSLNRQDFLKFMERSPALCLKLLEITMNRLRNANEQIYALSFLDVRSRIMRTLSRLAEDYGVPIPGGLMIDLKLTHQQIANLVGTVRESVTKVLQELQDRHVVSVENRRIIVHKLEKLKDF